MNVLEALQRTQRLEELGLVVRSASLVKEARELAEFNARRQSRHATRRRTRRAKEKPVSILKSQRRSRLTARQLQVLQSTSRGRSYRETGDQLGIAATTVANYMQFARWRLRARNNEEAIAEAMRRGLIS